jgi:hypothetical protein
MDLEQPSDRNCLFFNRGVATITKSVRAIRHVPRKVADCYVELTRVDNVAVRGFSRLLDVGYLLHFQVRKLGYL